MVSACSRKSQQRQGTEGFYHDTGRKKLSTRSPWGLNFHQATSTWFSRKTSLRRSQLDKAKNKGQSCPCLQCGTNRPGTNTSQLVMCFTRRSCRVWSLRPMCHSTCTECPRACGKAGVGTCWQSFRSSVPSLQLCPATLIWEKNWRAAQTFYKCFPSPFTTSYM